MYRMKSLRSKLEVGEAGDEKDAAARELEEETQYQGDLELIYEFYTAIGFCNEKLNSMWRLISNLLRILVHLMMMNSLKFLS